MISISDSQTLCDVLERKGWELSDTHETEFPKRVLEVGHEYFFHANYSSVPFYPASEKKPIIQIFPAIFIADPIDDRWEYFGSEDENTKRILMFKKMLLTERSALLYNDTQKHGLDTVFLKHEYLLDTFRRYFRTVGVSPRRNYRFSEN